MEEIQKVKERLRFSDEEDEKAEAIRKALEKLESAIQNEAPRKGGLKRKASPGSSNVNPENVLDSERQRNIEWRLTDFDEEEKESPGKRMMDDEKKNQRRKLGKVEERKGDRVSIPTKTFGDEYAKGEKKTSYGIIKSHRGKMVNVLWEGSDKTWKSHETHLTKFAAKTKTPITTVMLNAKIEELEKEIKIREWLNAWSKGKTRMETIYPTYPGNPFADLKRS
jgi:hypothetical protein